jgi:DNA polymerase III delta subunit
MGRTPRQIMEAYAAAPSDQAVLLLRSGAWRPGNLDKAVARVGWVYKCDELAPGLAVEWAIGRCEKRHGSILGRESAVALVQTVGTDLARIDSELGKLSVAAAGGEISVQHVRDLVGVSRDEQFWAIQPTLLSGDAQRALTHLHELIELSRVDLVPLTYTFIDLARKLHGVSRGLAQGASAGDLMRRFKLWGPAVDAVMSAARRVKPDDAAALLHAVVEADVRQKRSEGDPVRALEILTLRFTSLASS